MEKNWWQEADFDFIRIPKELFRNPYYGTLSAESKLLYGFLLDRVSLSWLNGEKWRTPEGEPFVIYTLAEIQQLRKVGKANPLKQLGVAVSFGAVVGEGDKHHVNNGQHSKEHNAA